MKAYLLVSSGQSLYELGFKVLIAVREDFIGSSTKSADGLQKLGPAESVPVHRAEKWLAGLSKGERPPRTLAQLV